MFELGQQLKKARLDKGISMEDLQETTKIRKRYLEAIEEGNFKDLPGNFYVRAFIKSYAEAVGLDPSEVLSMYKNVIPATAPETVSEPLRRNRTPAKSAIKWNVWATGVILWAFFILIAVILYYVLSHNASGGGTKFTEEETKRLTEKTPSSTSKASGTGDNPQATSSSTPTPAPTPTPTPTPVPEVKLVKTEDGVDYYAVTQGPVQIQLTVTGDECYYKLDKVENNKRTMIEQGQPKKGQTKTWTQAQSTFLLLGKANAVELKVNGTVVNVGEAPNPKRFQFDPGGAPLPSGSPATVQ
ncbi:helix-turn-helix domain-containing protein [Paenibacillus sp. CC-CFT747]|nr:helix-turn-helix domain-containing protein [Paenibacillus sp. CC-CFT747]